jgi:hypothetical protein
MKDTRSGNDVISDVVPINDYDLVRKTAMEKKNNRQEQAAIKAIEQNKQLIKKSGVGKGAVVTLKVDVRTHSHACGLLAIVYKSLDTGGAIVCCEHGVVTSSGTKQDFWVPADKYKVVAGVNEDAALSNEMQAVRDTIKKDAYDYAKQPRISYAKYHEMVIGASSPTKRGCCTCKKGCEKSTCGCLKKNMKCHSKCRCNGNCEEEP